MSRYEAHCSASAHKGRCRLAPLPLFLGTDGLERAHGRIGPVADPDKPPVHRGRVAISGLTSPGTFHGAGFCAAGGGWQHRALAGFPGPGGAVELLGDLVPAVQGGDARSGGAAPRVRAESGLFGSGHQHGGTSRSSRRVRPIVQDQLPAAAGCRGAGRQQAVHGALAAHLDDY